MSMTSSPPRWLLTACATVTALTLAGCGDDDGQGAAGGPTLPPSTSSSPTSESQAAERTNENGVALNERGNIVKQLGEEAGISAVAGGDRVVSFTIDEIQVDPQCDSGFQQPPANGHYVAIALRVATTPDYDPVASFLSFTAYDFRVIGPDGLTVTEVSGNAYSCLDSSRLFPSGQIGPGQQYAGSVVIDVPVTSGALIFAPGGAPGGWEWQY